MNIALSPSTQKLLEEQMKKGDFSDPDEVVRLALQTLDQVKADSYDELPPEARSAIEKGQTEFDSGLAKPWEQVRQELEARFINK